MVSRSPRRSLPLLCSCVLLATLASAAFAQPAFQVADINTRQYSPDPSYLREHMESLGDALFFIQEDGVHGSELWKTDGTPGNEVLVKDICPGACSSLPMTLTRVGNRLVFFADDGAHGVELWSTDGTPAGTLLIADFWPGVVGGGGTEWTLEMDGAVYFPGNDRLHGIELWKTDGTAAGTTLVADIRPGPEGSLPVPKMSSDGLLLLNADDGTHGREPWLTDGTVVGTRLLKDINPGSEGSITNWDSNCLDKDSLAVSSGLFLFQAWDGTHGRELWASDGTEVGTYLVRDIYPGTWGGFPCQLTELAGTVYFSAGSPMQGTEIWRTDGTEAGTSLVKDIESGERGSSPKQITVSSGRLFFHTFHEQTGSGLWTSDGTAQGTILLKHMQPDDYWVRGRIHELIDYNGILIFFADNGSYWDKSGLWKSDGTKAGTVFVHQLTRRSWAIEFSPPAPPVVFRGRVVFPTIAGGSILSASDGTSAGTEPIVRPRFQTSSISSETGRVTQPSSWGPLGDKLVFDPGTVGTYVRPYITDGTAAGTQLLADTTGYFRGFTDFTPIGGGRALFSNGALWVTDGTQAGTRGLTIQSQVRELIRIGDMVYFFYFDTDDYSYSSGHGLWKTPVTMTGQTLVALLPDGPGPDPIGLTAVGSTLFFVAPDKGMDTRNSELWKSDGTAAGTVLVKDIRPGSEPSLPDRLTNVAGRLFFSAQDGTHGRELWKSDGTVDGTVLVKDIVPGPLSSMEETSERNATAVLGSTLFFVVDDLTSGPELWASDSTGAGTRRVKDIRPGIHGAYPQELTVAGGRLFFSADDGTRGRELWMSDGTEAGTTLVEDIVPGAGSSLPRWLTAIDDRLVFSAFEESTSVEPWVSDGTVDGTRRLDDIAPGPLPSTPGQFTAAGSYVYFGANDATTGSELWAIPRDKLDPALDFYTVAPCRAVDTRASSPLASGVARTFPVAGVCGVPADAEALAVNLTVFGPTGSGNVVAWPAGLTVPSTSNVNFMAWGNRANNAILEMGDGQIQALARMAPGATVHFILDVVGYFR